MEEVLRRTAEMKLGPPASRAAIAAAERALGKALPADYVGFLLLRNGGEGPVGEGWARFIPVEDLAVENSMCSALDHLVDLTVFGSNGGGEAYAFDTEGNVVVVPWIGEREDAIPQGRFSEFVARLAEGRLFERGS